MKIRKIKYEERKRQGKVKAKSDPVGHTSESTPVRRPAESPAQSEPKPKKSRLGTRGGKPVTKPRLCDRKPVPDEEYERHVEEIKQLDKKKKKKNDDVTHMMELLWQVGKNNTLSELRKLF